LLVALIKGKEMVKLYFTDNNASATGTFGDITSLLLSKAPTCNGL
jgi:hypothetical protein